MKKTFTHTSLTFILLFFCFTNVHAQWQQTNGPFGGVISAIESDGTHLYASCRGGGLYRSDDNGLTWPNHFFDGTFFSFTDLLADGSKLYGASNNGFAMSTDNGLTWTISSTGLTSTSNCLLKSGSSLFTGTWHVPQ